MPIKQTIAAGFLILTLLVALAISWSSPPAQLIVTAHTQPQGRGQATGAVIGMNREFRLKQLWVAEVANDQDAPAFEDPIDHLHDSTLMWCIQPGDQPIITQAVTYGKAPKGADVLAPFAGKAPGFTPGKWYAATLVTPEGKGRVWFQAKLVR